MVFLFLANPYVRVYAIWTSEKYVTRNTSTSFDETKKGPEGSVDKPFLWTEGRVSLRSALNKSAYGHGEHISVTIDVRNDSRKIIRKIRVSVKKGENVFLLHIFICLNVNVLN